MNVGPLPECITNNTERIYRILYLSCTGNTASHGDVLFCSVDAKKYNREVEISAL